MSGVEVSIQWNPNSFKRVVWIVYSYGCWHFIPHRFDHCLPLVWMEDTDLDWCQRKFQIFPFFGQRFKRAGQILLSCTPHPLIRRKLRFHENFHSENVGRAILRLCWQSEPNNKDFIFMLVFACLKATRPTQHAFWATLCQHETLQCCFDYKIAF